MDRDIWPGVTGMMVRADDWQVEWLEGGQDDIAALRAQTMADPGLAEVITLAEGAMPARQFGRWSLVYEGRAVGIEQIIARAAAGAAGGREGLLAMLSEFSPKPN
ncbi:BLUF domain-containing protein [Sphingomonas sp. HITSZ_GF]|uniref:BLUF domain-containing protein n=1 Tax=Sphingomonas sp. HITSZ_GF TaxID=3037247 RepID=UPI00240D9D00|nr:BLUF domain-containing protein [Sphingomonas sp. HITSZ_GF]MDG2535909.1 BLUF domain-containing protein [Sphingomonas sp. HITSZ_GF]